MKTQNDKNWIKVYDTLSEAQKRWISAQRAIELGFGGITAIRKITGMSRTTITKGIRELKGNKLTAREGIRKKELEGKA